MERKEKTGFILEQVALCIEQGDFTQGTILSRKITTRYFNDKKSREDQEIMDLKLRFYEQQIQIAKQDDKYLEACKHYRAILDTPSIEADASLQKQVTIPDSSQPAKANKLDSRENYLLRHSCSA